MKKGFSTLEVIISIAVAAILLAIVTNSFQIARLKKQQQGIVESIAASIEEQKTNTQTGKEGKNYGVKFNATDFVLFEGTTYTPSATQNKIIAIDPQFEITDTITNSDNILYFSKLLGESNQLATITISNIDSRINPQSIVIEKSGTISVIE